MRTWRDWALIVILLALLVVWGVTMGAEAATVNETADMLYANNSGEWGYLFAVDRYVNENIEYRRTGTWAVKTAELTLETRSGDCSEMAVLKTAMLVRHGIDAKVIHGDIPGAGLHDTVEVRMGGFKPTWIDRRGYPGFHKRGDGLAPGEYIVGVAP